MPLPGPSSASSVRSGTPGPGSDAAPSALDALAPSARRATPRVRLAVGGAVVLFVAAVASAAVVSFAASGAGDQGVVEATVTNDAEGGTSGADGGASDEGSTGASIDEPRLLIHVAGAVNSPGIVDVASGARVVDAVAAAGGLAPTADPAGINLARPVVDGEQLMVPVIGAASAPGSGGGPAGGAASGGGDGVVHLNAATVADLDTLPRIGPALAQRIIDFREANGPFTSVEQLLDVAGIGDAVFAGLVDRVAL